MAAFPVCSYGEQTANNWGTLDSVPSKCAVAFTEVNSRVVHEIEVEATSLYEALARAIKTLQDSGWRSRDLKSDVVEVRVLPKQPIVRHLVLLKNFEAWLSSVSGSPEDVARRRLVRQILGRSAEPGRRS